MHVIYFSVHTRHENRVDIPRVVADNEYAIGGSVYS